MSAFARGPETTLMVIENDHNKIFTFSAFLRFTDTEISVGKGLV
jgi:hypothetical protein